MFIPLQPQVYFLDGIKMKNNRCYPLYSYLIYLVFFILLIPFSFLILSLPSKTGNVIFVILPSVVLGVGFVLTFLGFLLNNQSFYIEGNYLIVKNCLYEVMRVNLSRCDLQIASLPTYSSWTSNIFEKWICIYDATTYVPKFIKGCSNSRRYCRIQIVYSEKVYRELKAVITQIKTSDSNIG